MAGSVPASPLPPLLSVAWEGLLIPGMGLFTAAIPRRLPKCLQGRNLSVPHDSVLEEMLVISVPDAAARCEKFRRTPHATFHWEGGLFLPEWG